jgi:GTP-binding protein
MSRISESAHWRHTAGSPESLPPEGLPEVAFVGRSNAGKSSAINAITGRKGLAFVSKTPGRTRTINFFRWGTNSVLVDLPGYGYAVAPRAKLREWGELISAYLSSRSSLRGLILVMDARHPLKGQDLALLDWVAPAQRPTLVLLTKSDKLARAAAASALRVVRNALRASYPWARAELFSAASGMGVATARSVIAHWVGQGDGQKNPPAKGE